MKLMKKMAAVVVAATVAMISMAGMSSMTTSAADQIASAYFIGGFCNELAKTNKMTKTAMKLQTGAMAKTAVVQLPLLTAMHSMKWYGI